MFALRQDARKIRLCLIELNAHIINEEGGDGGSRFMGLEMQAKKAQQDGLEARSR